MGTFASTTFCADGGIRQIEQHWDALFGHTNLCFVYYLVTIFYDIIAFGIIYVILGLCYFYARKFSLVYLGTVGFREILPSKFMSDLLWTIRISLGIKEKGERQQWSLNHCTSV